MSPAQRIVIQVAREYGVDPESVVGKRRFADLVRARIEITRRLTARKYSTTQIGRVLNRDHTMASYYLGRRSKKVSESLTKRRWCVPKIADITPPPPPAVRRCLVPYVGADIGYERIPYERATP